MPSVDAQFCATEHPDTLDQRLPVFRRGGRRCGEVTEGGHQQERGESDAPSSLFVCLVLSLSRGLKHLSRAESGLLLLLIIVLKLKICCGFK